MTRIVKREVKELCLKMCNSKTGSKEWKQARDKLQRKWRFTPYNLLALYSEHPTIEYNIDNHHLITEGTLKNERII